MVWLAIAVALTAVATSWIYQDVLLPLQRMNATRNLPDPTEGHWLLGHIPALLAKPMQSFRMFHAWAKQYGPIYRIRFFWRPVVVVTDPDVYQPLLRSGPGKLQKHTPPYKMFEVFVKPPRSNMLSSGETAVWKSARRAAVAALTMNNLRLCFPHITAVTQRLIDSLAAAGPDVRQDMDLAAQQITVDVIGMAAFDRDLQATLNRRSTKHENNMQNGACTTDSTCGEGAHGTLGNCRGITGRGPEVLEVMRHLVVAMQSRNHPFNRWFPWRKAYRDLMYWGGRMSELVLDLMQDMEARPPPPHSLGAHMMACKHSETGQPLERMQIMTELGVLWGAGFETTAHSICWALLMISTHPEVESRVLAELDSLGLMASPVQPQPSELKWEHLAQLKYLSAALNESMRMFPAVSSGTIRVTHKPITLAGHNLPAGQPILIPFFAVHRSPLLWDEPDKYRPDRWLRDEATAAAAATAPTATAGANMTAKGVAVPDEDNDYVDVAADIRACRDQDVQQHPGGGQASSAPAEGLHNTAAAKSSSGLELKDAPVTRRGFLPFSEGSRNCVGQALALVELKAVLAMLLGNFKFSLAPEMGGYEGVAADARQAITLRPEHGLIMTLKHRSLV